MKRKTVIIGGNGYRIHKLPAVAAKEYMDKPDVVSLMAAVSVHVGNQWVALDDESAINAHVPSWEVLVALEKEVKDFNFAFLKGWVFRRAPTSGVSSIEPRYFDSFFFALTDGGCATYAELKTVYDLEDAFKMLDGLITKRINEHYAMKAAGR
ncbi:hypothetical protein [Burkholderia phage BCSR129]|nr:hypothetical protein [Burkholderia phage BCSR129]